jgi:hypothetical protein
MPEAHVHSRARGRSIELRRQLEVVLEYPGERGAVLRIAGVDVDGAAALLAEHGARQHVAASRNLAHHASLDVRIELVREPHVHVLDTRAQQPDVALSDGDAHASAFRPDETKRSTTTSSTVDERRGALAHVEQTPDRRDLFAYQRQRSSRRPRGAPAPRRRAERGGALSTGPRNAAAAALPRRTIGRRLRTHENGRCLRAVSRSGSQTTPSAPSQPALKLKKKPRTPRALPSASRGSSRGC